MRHCRGLSIKLNLVAESGQLLLFILLVSLWLMGQQLSVLGTVVQIGVRPRVSDLVTIRVCWHACSVDVGTLDTLNGVFGVTLSSEVEVVGGGPVLVG